MLKWTCPFPQPIASHGSARKLRFESAGAWLLAALLLAACRGTGPGPATSTPAVPPSPTAPPPPVVVRINPGKAPDTLDPALVGPLDDTANDIVANIFAGLAVLDGDTGQVKPLLAKSWQTADNLTWQVTLRDDIFWVRINPDTGQLEKVRPVKAGDAVAAAQRACRGDTHAPMIEAALLIKGCAEINQQKPDQLTDQAVAATIAVRALNDTTVEYTLTAKAAYFPTLLSMPVLAPIPADLIAKDKDNWTQPENVWSSGPYTLRPGVPVEQGYALVANPFWPIKRTGNVDGVEIVFDPEASKSFAAWAAGDMALTVLPSNQVARAPFGDDPRFRLLARPAAMFIAASYDTPPLDNPNVRRALALALNKQAVIDKVLRPSGQAALSAQALIPPGSTDAPNYGDVGTAPSPDAARQALAAAGFAKCDHLPDIVLLTDDSDLSKALGAEIAQQWTTVLGCPEGVIQAQSQPLDTVLIALRTSPEARAPRRAGAIMLNWQADYPDSYHWLADILGCKATFPTAYLDQKRPCIDADTMIDEAAATADDSARQALYKSIEDALFSAQGEMPVIPVFFYARPLALSPKVEVYPLHSGPLRFDQWVVSP